MDNGLEDLQVNCTGSVTIGNHTFHCYKKEGHGHVDLRRGIQVSCDVFFYEVARRLGIDRMEAAARALGLGAPTGIEMPGENDGFIPSQAWKLSRYGVPWQLGDTISAGIGQGYVVTTPIQLCTLAARLASGRALIPRITHMVGGLLQPRPIPALLPFSEKAFAAVRDGLNAVCNEPGGTAYAWRIAEPGFEMAGKTGTAQVRRISKEEHLSGVRKNESLPWNLRDHALYFAFAPVLQPRYACMVLLEHGAVGAHPHVQMARDILLFAQRRDPVKMPTAYPVRSAQADTQGERT
jgi:penicillin-binding protein 2